MPSPFTRTLRSLDGDRPRSSALALAIGTVLFGAWMLWLLGDEIGVYVQSPEARLEIEQAAQPIQVPVSGRVATSSLTLGRTFRAGDVLLEIDVESQRLELSQGRARLATIAPELEAAKRELEAQKQASVDEHGGTGASVAEAQARFREAEAALNLAAEELKRISRLQAEGLAPIADVSRAKAEHAQRRAAADAARLAVSRVAASGRTGESDRRALIQGLERQIVQLDGEARTLSTDVDRLEHEVARRTVRATVDGQLAEVASVTPGAMVKEGDRLGALLPEGNLRAVAQLAPHEALGWVRVGQEARLRLEGFPWAQHGTISAKVTRVASEVREGRVRVELSVDGSRSSIPLQHGLPGTVEIEVERAAPAVLLLRAAGKLLDRGPPAGAAPATSAAP